MRVPSSSTEFGRRRRCFELSVIYINSNGFGGLDVFSVFIFWTVAIMSHLYIWVSAASSLSVEYIHIEHIIL